MTRPTQEVVTILVAAAEPGVLEVLQGCLGRRGFHVVPAANGPAAVEAYRRRPGIDLVLLDVRMTPWDGPRTLAELRAVDPDVRVAFMTGGAGGVGGTASVELLLLGAVGVFEKPFRSFDGLAAGLRAILDSG